MAGSQVSIAATLDRLADQSLAEFLDSVAGATPAPGGGSSAAATCALAAALVEMAAGIGGGGLERPPALRARALELADVELTSYAPVLEALRLPRDDPSRAERLRAALLEASRSQLKVAELGAEVAELGVEVAQGSSAAVRGDALAGVVLAEAAAAAAARLVEINLAESRADDLLERARAARERAAVARAAT
jgi:methenyltetrahydrofolate cyclohydrolase